MNDLFWGGWGWWKGPIKCVPLAELPSPPSDIGRQPFSFCLLRGTKGKKEQAEGGREIQSPKCTFRRPLSSPHVPLKSSISPPLSAAPYLPTAFNVEKDTSKAVAEWYSGIRIFCITFGASKFVAKFPSDANISRTLVL